VTISRSTFLITADESQGARTDSTPYSHYSLLVSLEELSGPDVYLSNWCTL
jgi:hypothetical protein